MNNKGKIAISEIILLLIGIIAFAYAVGGMGFVSATEEEDKKAAMEYLQLYLAGRQALGGKGGAKPSSTTTPAGYPGWNPQNLFKYESGELTELYNKILQEDKEAVDALTKALKADKLAGEDLGAAFDEVYYARINANTAKETMDAAYEKWIWEKDPTKSAALKADYEAAKEYYNGMSAEAAKAEKSYNYAKDASKDAEKNLDGATEKAAKTNAAKEAATEPPGGWAKLWDGFVSSVSYGVTAYGLSYLALEMFGADPEYKKSIPPALGAAFFTGRGTYLIAKELGGKWAAAAGWIGAGIGALTFLYVYSQTYEEESFKITKYSCNPWKAPTGGDYCHLCNEQALPCSEYQCKSLGQACELLNDEDTGEQFCAWINENDVIPPTIEIISDSLPINFTYDDDEAISPPSRGVIINYSEDSDGCIPAFFPLTFGITTTDGGRDEPAICRVDVERLSFENMKYAFEEPERYRVNHTFTISLPSIDSLESENLTLENNGEFEVYTKCMDANGNENKNDFVFKFCVQKGPDTQPPYALGTNIGNNMPIGFGKENFSFSLYLNEYSECKWSVQDKDFDSMINNMTCYSGFETYKNRMAWICNTTLTGIKDREKNRFYFRCKDQPDKESDRNENTQELFYDEGGFFIIGTQPLLIDDAGPNGTIRDSALAVEVILTAETSAGYNEGNATCYYSEAEEENFIEFYNTNSYTHSTYLYLPENEDGYEYIIKCIDLGGNEDRWQVNFTTESDSEPPLVVRVYKDENFLKIITDEIAECVYDTKSCSYLFTDGLPMTDDEEDHFVDWDTKTKFYIKCRDEYGNEPDECSAIIKTIE